MRDGCLLYLITALMGKKKGWWGFWFFERLGFVEEGERLKCLMGCGFLIRLYLRKVFFIFVRLNVV